MRRAFTISGALLAVASATAVILSIRPSSQAEQMSNPFASSSPAIDHDDDELPTPHVYLNTPISPLAAKVWVKLRQPVSMPFANEAPLDDVIKYIKSSTQDAELPNGIPIYVDPAGLQEAEQTLQSPITITLEGIPLATSLGLLLKQLDLSYRVQQDGLVVITYTAARDAESGDPTTLLLNEMNALRAEVQALRYEIASLRGRISGATGGGAPQLKLQLRPADGQPSGGAKASP